MELTPQRHDNVDYFEDLTGEIKETKPKAVEEIGSRIKKIRESKGLSISELAKLTGFEIDLLTQIENETVKPQLGTITKLSKVLDSAFSNLVSGSADEDYSITRKNEERDVSRATSGKGEKDLYLFKSLAPEVKGRHMEAFLVKLNENAEKETSIHEGEEFIYVLSGSVYVKIGDEETVLSPGDSIYYLSTKPHVVAANEGTADILAVLYEG